MIASTGVDWTIILTALITAIPAIIAALLGASNRRSLKTPSGDTIGRVAERTHDLAAVSTLALGDVQSSGPMVDAARRLNASTESPVKVNGETGAATAEPPA